MAAGLVDEVEVGLVPVVLGRGKRFFGDVVDATVMLDDPHVAIQGHRVTHLRYRLAAR